MMDQAHALAGKVGRNIGASIRVQVEQNVAAAIADADAATAMASGRL